MLKPTLGHDESAGSTQSNRPVWIQIRAGYACVEARSLLGDADELQIIHGERTYILRRTRQNKLILVA
ncbi:hemin uptake protein HemP [Parvibium lacunae]|uniref:Hemin uptake protein HemP n=1 Tax=Parvibium lacunae TaxID=1888893 RepID=A0A368L4C8_9BURK|nr:hemin uptake protein HemP [Parvibium lacunae]RCS58375.1 hemin uptake protein HemP [Parvibium lacunae]